MMDCVDTSDFPMERKQSWVTLRSLVSGNDANLTNDVNRGASLESMFQFGGCNAGPSNAQASGGAKTEGNPTTNYSKFNAKDSAAKLKRLLSSGSFSTMEKKASVSALLGLLETQQGGAAISRSDVNELLRNLGVDYSEDELKQLSGQNLFRSFIHTPGPTMDRKKSFDVIQSILNSCSNTAIHKPMTSQDSFRFQTLANCLDTIETAVAKYEEDANDEDEQVVAVDDNLDNLLDDNIAQSPAASSTNTAAVRKSANATTDPFGRISAAPSSAQPNVAAYGSAGRALQQHGSSGQYNFLNATHHMDSTCLPANVQQQTQHLRRDIVSFEQQQQVFPHHQQQQQSQQQGLHHQQASHMYGNPDMAYGRSSLPPPSHMMGAATSHPNQYMYNYTNHHQQHLQELQSHQLLQQSHPHPHQMPQHPPSNYTSHGLYQSSSQLPSPPVAYGYGYAGQPSAVPPTASQASRDLYQQEHANGSADSTQYAKFCTSLGCNNIARTKGMCKVHGGGRRCKVDGCMKSAQTGHLCIAHGGGKPCRMEGCPKTAQSRGLCKQHGGGVRCKFDGCTKSCQSGGYCRGHGGGKRCEFAQCKKWAQRNGFCAKHAQEMTT
ncbi:hypothetical protein DYB32_000674 [Aphanomyces invadans]|uniref:WRKY19-like zinc finger domain-containing protein n=1 Tax=Aphanomyces invadans TaxID=157072 RepID=A0A418B958_9STRA|nr:hypothetical protein DYB32_000674 [Aphanomyces invadans]